MSTLGQEGGLFQKTTEVKPPTAREVAAAERVAEKAIEQRDAALRRSSELESEVDGLEVQLQQLRTRADRLASSVRRVVDNPLESPDARQGQLLNAIQRWDGGRV